MGKNIWIVNHYALPPSLPGGTRHFDLSKKLVEAGFDVTIFASSFHYQRLKDFKEYDTNEYFIRETIEGVKFVWFKTLAYKKNNYKRFLNMLSFSKQFNKYVKSGEFKRNPDIIIGSSVHLIAVNAAFRAARSLNARFFMEVRDIWPQTLVDLGVSKFHPLVLWFGQLEKKLYANAEKIIVLLPKANEHIHKFGISDSKIVYLPNGVDISRYPEEDLFTISDNDIFTVVYTGVIGKANNLSVAVQAARIFKDKREPVKFLIVGNGQEKEKLKELANAYHLENIIFEEAVPKEEVKNILAKADVLFFNLIDSPVFKFGLSSNKLFDYLASGKPIIFSSKAGNNPIEEAKAGISIEPNSPEVLYDAIQTLKSLPPSKLKQMGINGYEYVKRNHSIEILSERLINILSTD